MVLEWQLNTVCPWLQSFAAYCRHSFCMRAMLRYSIDIPHVVYIGYLWLQLCSIIILCTVTFGTCCATQHGSAPSQAEESAKKAQTPGTGGEAVAPEVQVSL